MRPYAESDQFRYPNAEIIVGLVLQLGIDRDEFITELEAELGELNYKNVRKIIVSGAMHLFEPLGLTDESGEKIKLDDSSLFKHISTYMDLGNALRRKADRGDLLALVTIDKIAAQRKSDKHGPRPFRRVAHILSSLKHPDEVHTLRRVYGPGFLVIGVHAPREVRINSLAEKFAKERNAPIDEKNSRYQKCKEDSESLVLRDEREPFTYGQRMEDAFQLADLFVTFSSSAHRDSVRYEIKRFLHLIMGDVSSSRKDPGGISSTPTKDEYGMFQAFSASLRSGAISRQIGAAIASASDREILALGCNDVPKAKGGLYWEDDKNDSREITKKEDSAAKYELEMLNDVYKVLQSANPGAAIPDVKALRMHLENTRIMKLVEFMREAHAEMDAISSAARLGISIRGSILYCTTFPCHECAKLIVASGIERVVYIEPYRKSRALELHSDSIEHDKLAPHKDMVHFEHFVGIGPSKYLDLFSISRPGRKMTRKDKDDMRIGFDPKNAQLRDPLSPNSYLDREILVTKILVQSKKKLAK